MQRFSWSSPSFLKCVINLIHFSSWWRFDTPQHATPRVDKMRKIHFFIWTCSLDQYLSFKKNRGKMYFIRPRTSVFCREAPNRARNFRNFLGCYYSVSKYRQNYGFSQVAEKRDYSDIISYFSIIKHNNYMRWDVRGINHVGKWHEILESLELLFFEYRYKTIPVPNENILSSYRIRELSLDAIIFKTSRINYDLKIQF